MKRALVKAGFEIYRARGDEVQLAERPRDNLIMDAGVTVLLGEEMRVRFVVRAQKADFAHESDEQLYERARALAGVSSARGYIENTSMARKRDMLDPGDGTRVLDTWYEVFFERVTGTLDDTLGELRFVLSLEKAVTPR